MKISLLLAAAALPLSMAASTLPVATAVQSRPDPSAGVILILPAGSEMPPASTKAAPPPAGWMAVDISGKFEGYVRNRDLTKSLDVIPGSKVYLGPKEDAGVLDTYSKGDKAEITGLHGGWTQISLEKTLVGYVQVGAGVPGPAAPAPAAAATAAPAQAPDQPGDAAVSRLYEGTLRSTHSILGIKHPYNWEIVGTDGKRVAYVDMSRLLLTDQIENYAGHAVVVLGSLSQVKGSDDLVVDAVGLRLK
ncbi:MAG TPA: hypothetical protein VGG34_12365 [Opitutaceae bacterium]|jgi:hypothetical protein